MSLCLELQERLAKPQTDPSKGFILVALILTLLITACQKSNVARASRDLASNITKTRTPNDSPGDGVGPIVESRVYIDSSLSMKGFVNADNHTTFDELLDEIGNVLPGCRLYKYGQPTDRAPENLSDLFTQVGFSREIHTADFYNLAYNPDDRLIDSLTRDDRAVLSVLITDGVYSEPQGSTSPPVVDAIQRWMQRGRVLGILTLNSSFNGPFYTERRRAMLPAFSVPSRPFYAFVFGPTDAAFIELEEKLRARFPNIRSILFSNKVVSIALTSPSAAKGLYSSKSPPETPFYWRMYDPELFTRNPASLNYTITYSIAPNYPATQFKIELIPDYYRWEQNHFKRIETGPPAGFNSEPQPDSGSNSGTSASSGFVITLPKDLSSDYGFYDFKINTSVRALRPEIIKQSTRDDSVRENAEKTYRFFEFISAVTEVHFTSQLSLKLSPAIFVTIANN